MTRHYVDSNAGAGANDGTSWTDAFDSFLNATVLAATGGTDEIWVASDHDEETQAPTDLAVAFSGGTAADPLEIYSVASADDLYTPGALIRTNGGFVTLTGHIRSFGVDYHADGLTRNLTIGSTEHNIRLYDCTVTAGNILSLTGVECYIRFTNCTIVNGDTLAITLGSETRVEITGGAITHANTGDLFKTNDNAEIIVQDCDLSSDTDFVNDFLGGGFRSYVIVRRCAMKSGFDTFQSGDAPSQDYGYVLIEASSAATEATPLGLTHYEDYLGAIMSTTDEYRTGGASDGAQANEHSWEMIAATTTREFFRPLKTPPIVKWVAGGAAITVKVFVASNVTLEDDQCWMELSGPAKSAVGSTTQGYRETTKTGWTASIEGDPFATPAALATDSVSQWEGNAPVATRQEMSITFTPDQEGPVVVRVCLAKAAGATIYVDPRLDIS